MTPRGLEVCRNAVQADSTRKWLIKGSHFGRAADGQSSRLELSDLKVGNNAVQDIGMPIDEEMIIKFKRAEACFLQQLFASDGVWDKLQLHHQGLTALLADRSRLQPLARRYKKNPVGFCERVMGPHWFAPPQKTSQRQGEMLLETLSAVARLLAAPEIPDDCDRSRMLKFMQGLTARPAGRKGLWIYAKALELKQANKSFHEICRQLNPAYAKMSPAERRNERERMRSGVARLEQKGIEQQGSRNTPR